MLHSFLVRDTSGKKSITATVFVYGALIVNLKMIFSGVTIAAGVTLANFGGSDYGMAMSALGAIYVLRRTTDKAVDKPTGGGK